MVRHFPKLMITRFFQEVKCQDPCIFYLFIGQISSNLCSTHSSNTVGLGVKETGIAAEPREIAKLRPVLQPLSTPSLPVLQQEKLGAYQRR